MTHSFSLRIQKADVSSATYIHQIVNENRDVLHSGDITLEQWQALLAENDLDECHYIIYADNAPAAWLKINGLLDGRTGWISMLAVAKAWQHRGIGTYAIRFSEGLFRDAGFRYAGIHTTEDNIPAKNLYLKMGYPITEYGNCTVGDGVDRMGYTFIKEL